jgi:hypothetical protein
LVFSESKAEALDATRSPSSPETRSGDAVATVRDPNPVVCRDTSSPDNPEEE